MNCPKDFPFRDVLLTAGEYQGIFWATSGAPLYGAANGYVRLPDGHPWLDPEADVDTHVPFGEITYREGNWIGFDTLHAWQYWPGMPEWMSMGTPNMPVTHMTRPMVTAWAELLAIEAAEHLVPHRPGRRDADERD